MIVVSYENIRSYNHFFIYLFAIFHFIAYLCIQNIKVNLILKQKG